MRWLKSVWTILGCIAAGIWLGLYEPELSLKLVPYGNLYLSFLKMCVIPIMVTAIVSSVGRLFMSNGSTSLLVRMILVFISSMFMVSALGIAVGLLAKPGASISAGNKAVLGTILLDNETGGYSGVGAGDTDSGSNGLMDFIFNLIPENIFIALGQGNSLQILFFSVVMGSALGFLSARSGDHQFLSIVDLLFKMFQKVISWSMYILPFGLLFIIAGQIAGTGVELMLAMFKFTGLIHVVALAMMAASGILISVKSKLSFSESLRGLKESLTIAFGTQNSIATMPSVLDALRNRFKLDTDSVNLVVPLGIVICRYSMVMIYSLGLIFIAQLYEVHLGLQELIVIWVGSVLTAIAGAGTPGIVAISMISLVAIPLQLPYSTGVILLMAVNSLINPIVTVSNIHINSAAAMLIVEKEGAGT
ncbi:dicarboxylate/amino acid:cation symporter [Cohnella fermenti]|uniref:Dicarboxylate/amino acid:cation symporter n=1 Tax=Cohnella fermenti TaxID=2565925 RepID=A0A4S4BRR1_9BACL|nr:cation:dicarboxylase symporter family transporter [Cohnella fermenti]THF77141.1 dicarboxylate/amino acid:cation symporter [Cohnella fermenti]